MNIDTVRAHGVRLSVARGQEEAGHAYVYVLKNDLHTKPFGFMEDVHVEERFRGAGVGKELVAHVINYARSAGCYKLIATSRDDGTRDHVHEWYQYLGFKDYGTEFRFNL